MNTVQRDSSLTENLQQLSDCDIKLRYERVFTNRNHDDPVRKAVVTEYERRKATHLPDDFQKNFEAGVHQ